MDIDEEPASAVNTCSRESQRQCAISFSVFVLILSILYVATTIVYTSYKMVVEMDTVVENHVIKVVGMYNSCAQPPKLFNVVADDLGLLSIGWHDPPLTYDSMLSHLYVFGTREWTVFQNLSIAVDTGVCQDLLLLWQP